MKIFIFVTILAAVYAKPSIVAPVAYPLPISISSQFHAQDSLGQYNYGYANSLSSKAEAKSIDGITRGAYSYIDAEGKLQSVQYISDPINGFRVAATNLPLAPALPKIESPPHSTPVQDTPEVAEAKSKHIAALKEAEIKATQPILAPTPIISYGLGSHLITYPAISPYAAPWIHSPFIINSLPTIPSEKPEIAKDKTAQVAPTEEAKPNN